MKKKILQITLDEFAGKAVIFLDNGDRITVDKSEADIMFYQIGGMLDPCVYLGYEKPIEKSGESASQGTAIFWNTVSAEDLNRYAVSTVNSAEPTKNLNSGITAGKLIERALGLLGSKEKFCENIEALDAQNKSLSGGVLFDYNGPEQLEKWTDRGAITPNPNPVEFSAASMTAESRQPETREEKLQALMRNPNTNLAEAIMVLNHIERQEEKMAQTAREFLSDKDTLQRLADNLTFAGEMPAFPHKIGIGTKLTIRRPEKFETKYPALDIETKFKDGFEFLPAEELHPDAEHIWNVTTRMCGRKP